MFSSKIFVISSLFGVWIQQDGIVPLFKKCDIARMRVKFAILMFLFSCGAILANPLGEWRVADGTTKIMIKKCEPNLCGKISWTADGDDLGKAILIDMVPVGGTEWKGTIVDSRDGTQYLGRILLQSETQLEVNGCVMGGAFCGGEVWTRTR